METVNYSCNECGCNLWSDYSKNLGVCPECKNPDEDHEDLETMLEFTLNQLD